MTHLPRPTLRALRSIVARAYGVKRSRVRVVERASSEWVPLREIAVRLVPSGRDPRSDWWSAIVGPRPHPNARAALHHIARRAWSNDLP